MAVYDVYYRSPRHDVAADMILLRDGICWPAFLFTVLWALGNRLWSVALGLAAANAVLAVIVAAAGLNAAGQAAVSLGFMAMVGYGAAGLHGWTLERRGYAFTDLIEGHGREEAERKFLMDRPDVVLALLDEPEGA